MEYEIILNDSNNMNLENHNVKEGVYYYNKGDEIILRRVYQLKENICYFFDYYINSIAGAEYRGENGLSKIIISKLVNNEFVDIEEGTELSEVISRFSDEFDGDNNINKIYAILLGIYDGPLFFFREADQKLHVYYPQVSYDINNEEHNGSIVDVSIYVFDTDPRVPDEALVIYAEANEDGDLKLYAMESEEGKDNREVAIEGYKKELENDEDEE